MYSKKSKVFPIIMTILIIVIIIYLFVTIKQTEVSCSKSNTDDLGIKVVEELNANLDGRSIKSMVLEKTIVLPDEYLDERDSVEFLLKKSYEYLDEDKVSFSSLNNKLIVRIEIDKDETIILNNIEFSEDNGLQVKINSNTKSSDVITLKVGDNYTEGELMTRMKNNGYVCK